MSPGNLLEYLGAHGVHLKVNQGRLIVDAPPGLLTPELKAELAACKAELLDLLAQTPQGIERLAQGPYQGFYVSTEVPRPDPVRARQALDEAELWRQKRAAWLRSLLRPDSRGVQ